MTPGEALAAAAAVLGARARRDEPIGARTTYRVGGRAALYLEITDEESLELAMKAVGCSGVELLVLGKGSNLLVADAGFEGLCVALGGRFEHLDLPEAPVGPAAGAEPAELVLEAGAALAYPVLARRCVPAGFGGLSWAVGIPGSLGGAVAMNAGGHGSETAEHLVSAEVADLARGEVAPRSLAGLGLSYRHSELSATEVVLSARLRGRAAPPEQLAGEIEEIVAWRRAHQPGGRNAGSVFANPPGDAAGRLIEEAGAKGRRHGSAVVSDKHANFIAAAASGSADDVAALIAEVRELVAERRGVELELEVRLVGFDR